MEEPVDDNCPDKTALNMASAVKVEPSDVIEDLLDPDSTVESYLEATIQVKHEMSIGPIVLQPPDVHFTPRPYKTEPVEDTPVQNSVTTASQSYSSQEESASTYNTSPHVGVSSADQDNAPYRCDICQKTFTFMNTLRNHVCTIQELRKYYTEQKNFKKHLLMHSGEQAQCCGVCKKYFTEQRNFRKDLLMNKNERPHCCGICKKRFAMSGNLKQHLLIHTGERPHGCHICRRRFTQSSGLKRHLWLHTDLQLNCDVCKKRFSNSRTLKKHLLIHK